MADEESIEERVSMLDLTIKMPIDGGVDILREFNGHIALYDEDAGDDLFIGFVSGLVGWRIQHEDIWDAADAISGEAEVLGAAARDIMGWLVDNSYASVDSVLLVERIKLHKEVRGNRLARAVVEQVAHLLRLDQASTLIVLQPEPQQEEGGPYPPGPERDEHLARLRAAHEAIGFLRWADSDVWWLPGDLVDRSYAPAALRAGAAASREPCLP